MTTSNVKYKNLDDVLRATANASDELIQIDKLAQDAKSNAVNSESSTDSGTKAI